MRILVIYKKGYLVLPDEKESHLIAFFFLEKNFLEKKFLRKKNFLEKKISLKKNFLEKKIS